jgi:Domain of unknown function (DUF4410)
MKTIFRFYLTLATISILSVGCTTPYKITSPLEQPLSEPTTISVGTIQDELPPDTPDKKKPTQENIEKFRSDLQRFLVKEKIVMGESSSESSTPLYEVRGSILSHKKGSGALRFFIGFGAGSAKLTTHLELVELSSNTVVFAGNFTGAVTDWMETGNKMWEQVAKNFVKALKKQAKKLGKNPKS